MDGLTARSQVAAEHSTPCSRNIWHDGDAFALQALLDQEANPNTPIDAARSKEITKRLKATYRVFFFYASEVSVREERILNMADVVIATSKIADSDMFSPIVTLFDEAGMMTEPEGMLVILQFPSCRQFFFVGDYFQGGILLLSDEVAERQDSMTNLYQPKKTSEKVKLTTADYRRKAEMKAFKTPFLRHLATSTLEHMDNATSYVNHTDQPLAGR